MKTDQRSNDVPEKDPNIDNSDGFSQVKGVWGTVGRAVFGSFAAVIFGIAILLVSVMAVTNPLSVSPHESGVIGEKNEGKTVQEVQYYLPYPGVLPDSKLYTLKMVRDKLSLWTTIDGEKKARKELLYADKRINAAVFLLDGGKEDLAVTTATKAEKYLESSINKTAKLSKDGKDVKSLLKTLITASEKHLEILDKMQGKVKGENKNTIAETVKSTKLAHEKAEQTLVEAK
jgi:hypothetical protein